MPEKDVGYPKSDVRFLLENIALSHIFFLKSDFQLLTSDFCFVLLRKEVIQPHLPIRLPCYDFTPITSPTFDVSSVTASGVASFRGVTGGVYKARERIHRSMLTCDY